MRLIVLFIIALISGTVALGTLYYYYTLERDFTKSYKEVIAGFNQVQNKQERTTYGVLQSALFAYYNQDTIAQDRHELRDRLHALLQVRLLSQPHYADIRARIKVLEQETEAYIQQVERHLMINGAIKNSNVFLSNYSQQAALLFPPASKELRAINTLIGNISQAKKMLDKSYLEDQQEQIDLINKGTYTPQQEQFVTNLLTHAGFILKQYPEYLDVFYSIINAPLRDDIETVKARFTALAAEDMDYINKIASSLFVLILFAIVANMLLIGMLRRENTLLVALKEKLQYSLYHDALTQLKNRNSYEQRLPTLKTPSILLVNIVKFKFFNDFYGTDAGDMILKKTAQMLQEALNGSNGLCHRIGGDEFALLFEQTPVDVLEAVAGKINRIFDETRFDLNGISMHIAVNMAISDELPLLETADMALKHLKSNPSDNLIHYSPKLDVKEQIRSNIETTHLVHSALADDRVFPYYQPIVDLESRKVVKYEALARVRTESGKILAPGDFLPVAHNTSLYYQITRSIICKSLEYFADKPYRFSINLGMQDLEDEKIVSMILKELSRHGTGVTSRLDIELLETENFSNKHRVKAFIDDIKSFGCRIAIDDFGSGFSNFTHLSEFDIDIVKIDGSLIREVTSNEQHYKTVKAIMGLISELGVESVAEYVQDEASAQLLSGLGVGQAQGYYFGKPSEAILSGEA